MKSIISFINEAKYDKEIENLSKKFSISKFEDILKNIFKYNKSIVTDNVFIDFDKVIVPKTFYNTKETSIENIMYDKERDEFRVCFPNSNEVLKDAFTENDKDIMLNILKNIIKKIKNK